MSRIAHNNIQSIIRTKCGKSITSLHAIFIGTWTLTVHFFPCVLYIAPHIIYECSIRQHKTSSVKPYLPFASKVPVPNILPMFPLFPETIHNVRFWPWRHQACTSSSSGSLQVRVFVEWLMRNMGRVARKREGLVMRKWLCGGLTLRIFSGLTSSRNWIDFIPTILLVHEAFHHQITWGSE